MALLFLFPAWSLTTHRLATMAATLEPVRGSVWQAGLATAALAALCAGGGAVVGATVPRGALQRASAGVPDSPPPAAFSVVWALLYAGLGAAVGLVLLWRPAGSRPVATSHWAWVSAGLLACVLAATYAWPFAFAAGRRRAAFGLLAAALCVGALAAGCAALTNPVAALPVLPLLGWLACAAALQTAAGSAARLPGVT